MLKRILIVEAEESAALFLAESLARLGSGCQVEIAGSADEAGRKAARRPFDLIISSATLPGSDALALLQRSRSRHPHTRGIMLTSPEAPASNAPLPKNCASLASPFSADALLAAAREALQDPAPPPARPLILPAKQIESLARRLEDLRGDIGAQCIFLSDPLGQIVAQVGDTARLDVTTLTSLVGGGYATTFELARRLGQERALNLTYQEGSLYHLYSSNLGQDLLIIILFGKDSSSSRIGSVWLYTKRAIQDLLLMTSDLPATSPELVETIEATVWSPAENWPEPKASPAPAKPVETKEPGAPLPDPAPLISETTFSLEEALRLGLINPELLEGADH